MKLQNAFVALVAVSALVALAQGLDPMRGADHSADVPFVSWTSSSYDGTATIGVSEVSESTNPMATMMTRTFDGVRSGEKPEMAVLFVQKHLSADALARQFASTSSECNLPRTEALSRRSHLVRLAQQAAPGNPLESFEALYTRTQRLPSHNAIKYLRSIEFADAATDGQTDGVVVDLDQYSCEERDAVIANVLTEVDKATEGSFIAALTSESAPSVHTQFRQMQKSVDTHIELAQQEAQFNPHLLAAAGDTAGGPLSYWYEHNLYLDASILSGLSFGFLFILLAITGFGCLTSIQAPDRFEVPNARMNLAAKE